MRYHPAVFAAKGNTPFPGDDPQQPIFSGTGKRIEVNSENVSLLEYDDERIWGSDLEERRISSL